ncbi:hypothetical protein PENTCL1PPCAC_4170, partial [Pristionchus entomophagus]
EEESREEIGEGSASRRKKSRSSAPGDLDVEVGAEETPALKVDYLHAEPERLTRSEPLRPVVWELDSSEHYSLSLVAAKL